VAAFCSRFNTTTDDLLVILGDAGINYYGGPKDRRLKEVLCQLPITLLSIHGNHEKRPEKQPSYQEAELFGGVVYQEPDFSNLLFAKDGEIYELEGKRCVVIGGAYSVDKFYRLNYGAGWWPDEQPSAEIKERVKRRLEDENWNVDIVLSHTCPYKYVPREAFLPFIDNDSVDNSTEEWLDAIEEKLTYSRWYCGHYHIEKIIDNIRFLYNDFITISPSDGEAP